MKKQLLLFVPLLFFSSTLFGVEEKSATNAESAVVFDYEEISEKLDRVISPTSSPAVIPDLPRAVGEQNNSDQSKKVKAGFQEVSGFVFCIIDYSEVLLKWTSGPTFKQSLFILFRNLRI